MIGWWMVEVMFDCMWWKRTIGLCLKLEIVGRGRREERETGMKGEYIYSCLVLSSLI